VSGEWSQATTHHSTTHHSPLTTHQPKITDFGLAKRLHGGQGQTATGEVFGTPSYMAPEQAQGRARDIGPATDVYALGAILYELLTGRPPFQGATPLETLLLVTGQEPVPPSGLRPGVPRDLETICLKCLAKELAHRYASADALADDLRRFLEDRPILARPAGQLERLWRWGRRNPLVAALAAALLLTLVGGLTSVTWKWREAEWQRQLAEEEATHKRRVLYAADMQLAAQLWDSEYGTARTVSDLLAAQVPRPGEEDLRDFAWRYQWGRLHQNAVTFPEHGGGVVLGAFSPEGRLITIDHDGWLRNWDPVSRRATLTLNLAAAREPGRIALAPDGRAVAVVRESGAVPLLDPASGRELRVLPAQAGGVVALRFLPDGKALLTQAEDGVTRVWDVASGQLRETIPGTREGFRFLFPSPLDASGKPSVLSPDGSTLAVANYPQHSLASLLDWRKAGEKTGLLGTFQDQRSTIRGIAYSPDGKTVATSDVFGFVFLWVAATRKETGPRLEVYSGSVSRLGFSADGSKLATGGQDGLVTVWDVARRQRQFRLKGHTGDITFLAFAADGRTLASGSADGTAKLWRLDAPEQAWRVGGPIHSLACSSDGKWLAVGQLRGAQLRDARTGQVRHTLRGHSAKTGVGAMKNVTRVAFAPDGRTLATGGFDSLVKLWDVATGTERCTLVGRPTKPASRHQIVGSLTFSPDGGLLVAGFGHANLFNVSGHEHVVKVWQVSSGQEVCILEGHRNTVPALAFTPDGKLLATASHDGTVKLWEVGSWREVRTLTAPGSHNRVQAMAVSADGRTLATGGEDGAVRLWDVTTGTERGTLRGHTLSVAGLAYARDGRTLASASWDRTVRLWHLPSGRESMTLRGHTHLVVDVVFSPDGNQLATGSLDESVRFWKAASPEEIVAAQAEDRSLRRAEASAK
jgi:WD40 repeat protein